MQVSSTRMVVFDIRLVMATRGAAQETFFSIDFGRVTVLTRLVRERTSVSWEKFLLALHLLERFFAEARVIDPRGLHVLEKGVDLYNQVEVTVFQRYFISWVLH